MMDKEGGPAISLRDWFAGMALQGLLARDIPEDDQTRPEYETDKIEDLKRLSHASYECADAMLKERKHETD